MSNFRILIEDHSSLMFCFGSVVEFHFLLKSFSWFESGSQLQAQ